MKCDVAIQAFLRFLDHHALLRGLVMTSGYKMFLKSCSTASIIGYRFLETHRPKNVLGFSDSAPHGVFPM